MTTAERVSEEALLLSRLPLFSMLDPADLGEVAGALRRRTYSKGEVVYHQDDPPGSLFVIVRGTVKMVASVSTGKQVTIAWHSIGSFFGTINLFSDILRPENAIALDRCELLVLPRDEYRAFLRHHPEAMDAVAMVLSLRWQYALGRLFDMACLDVTSRIAKILVDLSVRLGQPQADGTTVIQLLTQPELASLVGATRESVHTCLNSFARQGWVEFHRGYVRVIQPDRLRERISR